MLVSSSWLGRRQRWLPLVLSEWVWQLIPRPSSPSFRVAALLEGKGGGRKGVYQGKAAALERREEVYTLIRDFKK